MNDNRSDFNLKQKVVYINEKLNFLVEKTTISLFIIGILGLLVRLYYFPNNIPLTLDALGYFFYATDISVLGHLPNYTLANNGWSIVLSFFFSIWHQGKPVDFMELQRLISISISALTIIPVYLLCTKFFDKRYSVIGAAIFVFEPRIIQNSLLGLTDPLYIFLGAFTLVLFLSSDKKYIYASFAVLAFTSLIRSEGLILFLPMSIMFLIHFRKEKLVIAKYALVVGIFLSILYPMMYYENIINSSNNAPYGHDQLVSRVPYSIEEIFSNSSTQNGGTGLVHYLFEGFLNLLKFLGWISIPIFIILVPLGVLDFIRNRDFKKLTILVSIIFMLIPPLYAYSAGIKETRYLYFLYPMFCVLSIFVIKKLGDRINNKNIFIILIISGILLTSSIFLEFKKIDDEHQKEALAIAKQVTNIASGINDYYPEDSYIIPSELPQKWPMLKSSIVFQTSIISTDDFNSLEKFIQSSKDKGLTHLVIDDTKSRPNFLIDVFSHEENYPYLKKVFDSEEYGYKYHVKIYKINYEYFDKHGR